MGGLYEGDLAAALRDSRARTLGCYAHLDLAKLAMPCIPIVNPAHWELAHIAWFQEHWCLRWSAQEGALVRPSILQGADALFNSSLVPHDSRWHLDYPPLKALRRYMDDTFEATLRALERRGPEDRYFFVLSLLHEDMHGEALLMTLQTLELPAPGFGERVPPARPQAAPRDIAFPAARFELGTARAERRFAFDNEKWAHPVEVRAFRMRDLPVTQSEFARFVDEGGYTRRSLWTEAGWAWRVASGRTAPLYWRRGAEGWIARRFDGWAPLDAHAPMVHVSLHEALAYCEWAGRRLPTEAEWEFAARNGGREDRYPWGAERREGPGLDARHLSPGAYEEPAASRSGLRHMVGNVWEWTSTPFQPYPGFRPDPYKDYSQPWFGDHYVLRGGCFATRSRLVHNRFRNFYLPHRNDAFAGFRTCARDAG